ncbi:MAG: hypothetical protein RLZ59_158 [Pseudomonadota bacterium]|jgi:hypothetical protein
MKFLLPLTLFMIVSACAPKGEFPSLAHRPIEAKAADLLAEPQRPAEQAPASDPARLTAIATVRQAALDAQPRFEAALAQAQKLAATAGPAQSESWIAAEIELSAAERAREPVKTALADLDTTLRQLMLDSPTSPDLAAVQQAIRDVEALDARQDAAIQSVASRLTRQ